MRFRLSDEQWQQIAGVLESPDRTKGGRPRASDRRLFEGVLWVLWHDSSWGQLPDEYGSHVTCWRRYKEWLETGVWEEMWLAYLQTMSREGQLAWVLGFLDGKFVPMKKQ